MRERVRGPGSPRRWSVVRHSRFRSSRALASLGLLLLLAAEALGEAASAGRQRVIGEEATSRRARAARQRRSLLQQEREQAQRAAVEYCATGNFTALYTSVDRDLQLWRDTGFTPSFMDAMLAAFPKYPVRAKGAGVAFVAGVPYMFTDPQLMLRVGHHKRLITAHLALFAALASTFGPAAIPDVEFIVSTADEPSVPLPLPLGGRSNATDNSAGGSAGGSSGSSGAGGAGNATAPPPPAAVVSFCKSDAHGDILAPDVHFFMRNHTGRLLAAAANFSAAWPWERKRPVLFGRFSPYKRAARKNVPALYRKGKGGKDICRVAGPDLLFCDVRKHLMWDWARGANRSGLPVDVAQQPKRDMLHHASHKWLLHLDGQTCSSRLEQLLALGSMVVKEESGYRAFFHHLIQPYVHYVPFWREVPEEAEGVLRWAAEHDAEAAAMAAAAQVAALTYTHKRALMCYWLRLLQGLASLMRYTPGPAAGARSYPHWLPVAEYLAGEGGAELARHRLQHMEFWD